MHALAPGLHGLVHGVVTPIAREVQGKVTNLYRAMHRSRFKHLQVSDKQRESKTRHKPKCRRNQHRKTILPLAAIGRRAGVPNPPASHPPDFPKTRLPLNLVFRCKTPQPQVIGREVELKGVPSPRRWRPENARQRNSVPHIRCYSFGQGGVNKIPRTNRVSRDKRHRP